VLDGGFLKWLKDEYEVTTEEPQVYVSMEPFKQAELLFNIFAAMKFLSQNSKDKDLLERKENGRRTGHWQ
jgi:3-mercaptopyruvate sulfurtransferase SseA